MRRILNRVVGRSFRSSGFKRLVQSSFTRLQSLTDHRRRRYSEDLNDVLSLLQDGLHKLALSRCEQMIKHQNLLDAYGLIEGYLNLLMERIQLLGRARECPDELKEAASSVVFAASRWKDFTELGDIKSIFTSQFGKEFTAPAVELRNNNRIIQKLSTKKPDMKSKMNLLKLIASDKGIVVQLNDQVCNFL
uniref:IST1-like protein n=1 Tax=Cucumis melo TaxID=3656 RepID=A0A9I9E7S2_CUCME